MFVSVQMYMRTYTSYLCCQADSKKSGITLWRVMQDNPCGSFTFDVLNYLYIIEINVGLLPINFFQFEGKTHLFSYFNCCAVHMVQKKRTIVIKNKVNNSH